MRQPRLYIAYSRADRGAARKLVDFLHRAYDEVWLDEHRYGGEVWWQELLWNLKACDIFIYLLSPQSAEAAYCLAEFAEAHRLRKQILPVLIQRQTEIPADLDPYPVFDMTGGLTMPKVGELLAALKQLEARFPEAPLPPLDPKPTPVPPILDNAPPRRVPVRRLILPIIGVVLLLVIGRLMIGSMVLGSIDPLPPTPTETLPPTPIPTSTVPPSATRLILPSSPVPPATRTQTIMPTSTHTPTSTLTPTSTPSATATGTPTITRTPTATIPTETSTSTVPPTVTRRAKVVRSTPTAKG